MNKAEAAKIADKMVKAKVSAYAGKPTLERLLRSRTRRLTDAQATKILRAFRERVVEDPGYSALDRLYCEDILNTASE